MPQRHVIVVGGVVVNAILSTAEFAATLGGTVVASDVANIGDAYSGGVFTPPAPPAPVVPASVTMRQARLALLAAGQLAAVEAAIAALPSPTKEAAQIEWQYSNEVQRHNGFVAQLGPALGLSDAQLDALFIAAGGIG